MNKSIVNAPASNEDAGNGRVIPIDDTKETLKSLNIHQRMHCVMRDIDYIQKEEKTVNGQYRFVSHDAVTAKVRKALLKNRIIATPHITESEVIGFESITYKNLNEIKVFCYRALVKIDIAFSNIDRPEDKIVSHGWIGMGLDTQDKAVGKAISYAYKYALLKIFALETGDDPEQDVQDFKPVEARIFIDNDVKEDANAQYTEQTIFKMHAAKTIEELQEIWKTVLPYLRKVNLAQSTRLTEVKDMCKKVFEKKGEENGAIKE